MGRIADTRELHPQLVSGRRATILIDDPEPQLELTRTCSAPDIGILVLVDSDDLEVILALLQAGATACIPVMTRWVTSSGALSRRVVEESSCRRTNVRPSLGAPIQLLQPLIC